MAPVDTRAGFLALLGIVLRHLDPTHHESTTQQVIGAADDILRAAEQHTADSEHDYHNARSTDDGMTQAERDAGWTPEQVAERLRVRELPHLPAIAAHPGNDQLAVLASLHADADIIDELRAEAAANLTDEFAPGSLFAEIAEHYPGVANELRAYVTNPNITTAARDAGGARFLSVSDGGTAVDAAARADVEQLHATGQVTDRRVPGDYVPPSTARDTSGDAERIAPDIARQEAGRQAFNLSQGGTVDNAGNGELPELAAAPGLGTDDAGRIQELTDGGAIQQDDAPGTIQQDDGPGAIVEDASGGTLQDAPSEQDGGKIQGADQGAGNAPQQ